jgi:hypothetical protein
MAGLFKDKTLNSFSINRLAPQYHLVSRYINMTESHYCMLDAAQADNQLHDNLDNKDFVDALIENARKQDDNAVLDTFGADAKADQDDDEEDYDSEDSIGFT